MNNAAVVPPLVVLVEDNPSDEALVLRAFGKQQIPVRLVVARDGAAALELLFGTDVGEASNTPERPRLVLLDLKLPKVPGLEVLRRLRSEPRTRDIPAVVFTSSAEERDLAECYRLGCTSYVCKPIESAQLISAIRQIVEYWIVLNLGTP